MRIKNSSIPGQFIYRIDGFMSFQNFRSRDFIFRSIGSEVKNMVIVHKLCSK